MVDKAPRQLESMAQKATSEGVRGRPGTRMVPAPADSRASFRAWVLEAGGREGGGEEGAMVAGGRIEGEGGGW